MPAGQTRPQRQRENDRWSKFNQTQNHAHNKLSPLKYRDTTLEPTNTTYFRYAIISKIVTTVMKDYECVQHGHLNIYSRLSPFGHPAVTKARYYRQNPDPR